MLMLTKLLVLGLLRAEIWLNLRPQMSGVLVG